MLYFDDYEEKMTKLPILLLLFIIGSEGVQHSTLCVILFIYYEQSYM